VRLAGQVAVVTGAASGIGRAAARRFAAAGAALVCVDRDGEGARAVARETDGLAVACDVGREGGVRAAVSAAEARHGRIDLYFSNAGVISRGGPEAPDEIWDEAWRVHVMAHVWAARAVVPAMLARGGGVFAITASAAGLLNIVESAPYGASKHAAVGFAEWLAIAYGRRGLQVACLCPQLVRTAMMGAQPGSAGVDGALEPEAVAESLLAALAQGRFLVLPHPQVRDYFRRKAEDYERWIGGMQKLYRRYVENA